MASRRARTKACGQRHLVLDRLHPADGPDEPMIWTVERATRDRGRRVRRGRESRRIDAVVDLRDAFRRDADRARADSPRGLATARRSGHERTIEPAHAPIRAAGAVEVLDVAAVLAVDAHRHPGDHAGTTCFERRQIAGMHDRGRELAEQPKQARIVANAWPGRLCSAKNGRRRARCAARIRPTSVSATIACR